MSVEMMELLVGIVFLSGVFTLIGMKMRYSYMKGTRVSGTSQQEIEQLAAAVDNLGAEVGLLRSEVLELNQRTEFTKLLEGPKTEE